MALALGISVAAVASPALAGPEGDGNNSDLGTVEKILAQSDRDTPRVGLGVTAGSEEPGVTAGSDEQQRPLVQQWRYENQEGQ